MAFINDSVLPQGSIVLVTGANGLVGANVVDIFLQFGFKVRGTVRDTQKHVWLVPFFERKYRRGAFELVEVKGLLKEGVSALIHIASDVSFGYNPHEVIEPSAQGAVNALKAAYAEPSVKRFIQCSSSSAAVQGIPVGESPITTTKDTYNEVAVALAWKEPYSAERGGDVYAASKTQQEQAIWKYHKEHQARRLGLVVNTVVPNLIFGKSLDKEKFGYPSTTGAPAALFTGQTHPMHKMLIGRKHYFVNTSDVARLFLAAATFSDVQSERIFAFGGEFSFSKALYIFRKHYPERQFMENFSQDHAWHMIPQRERAEELLKRFCQPGCRWSRLFWTTCLYK
uniref:NAD-dependent epimerase/dehydratase domain-containing protein n=1 Tax=Bionectria ochroleuca TaxID=29856 RepID=A0A8H7K1Q1_BIOOC